MSTTAQICYQRYSTAFKAGVAIVGIDAIYPNIPRSTRNYWKHQNFTQYLGFDLETQTEMNKKVLRAVVQNKRYASMCRGLLCLMNTLQLLVNSVSNKKALFRRNKMQLVEGFYQLKKYFNMAAIEKRLQVTSAQISRWKNEGRCKLSAIKLCFTIHPAQLTFDEQLKWKDYLLADDNRYLPVSSVWAKAQRESNLMIALETAYKYKNELLGKAERPKLAKPKTSILATHPFEILHMDSTQLVLANKEKVYIHFIMDNFSRAVLGAIVSYSSKSASVVQNLRNVIRKYHLNHKPFTLYCDGGPENEGDVNQLLNQSDVRITKVIANYLNDTTNNMAEAWHKRFKQIILKMYVVKNATELEYLLPDMIDFANHMYLPVLNTLSPLEVLAGKQYHELQVAERMTLAQQQRIQTNRAMNCRAQCADV